MKTFVTIAAIVLITAAAAYSRTWYITPDGTGDAPTIQAGIDSAAAADTVLLADGTFTGPKDVSSTARAKTAGSISNLVRARSLFSTVSLSGMDRPASSPETGPVRR